jgi:hypothetical protein
MPGHARLLAVASLFALTLGLVAPGASAQRDRPAPTACTVTPRSVDVVATPAAATLVAESPVGVSHESDGWIGGSADLPPGEPADPETVAQITAVARELAGCLNAADEPRLAALLTDAAVAAGVGRDDFTPMLVAGMSEAGGSEARWEIAWVRVRDVKVLPDGRVRAAVGWGVTDDPELKPIAETNVHVYARAGDRWLLDAILRENTDSDIDPILRRARQGFSEVDSALYAEPTMAGAKFSIEALVMVGFIGNDDYRGVSCEMFIFERGEDTATVSAFCRAEEALTGRAAYLRVQVYGPRRGNQSAPSSCEDAAPLAESLVFSCTVDVPLARAAE